MEATREVLDGLQSAINVAGEDRPGVGKRVEIERGKHKGKCGVVFWHGQTARQAAEASRYESNWMSASMREAAGRVYYRIGVQTDSGERFFTEAEYAKIL